MLQVAYSSLGDYLQSDVSIFDEDMSQYSLVDVLHAYECFKRRTSPEYSLGSTIYNIRQLEEKYNITIKPSQVTSQFYSLFEEALVEKELAPSTISHYFGTIATALNYASKYRCPVHPTYNVYKKYDYCKTRVALSADEVSHIYHFDISSTKYRADKKRTLDRVRDMFVLSCCLGQRYSDMIRLIPDMFDDTKTVLRLRQKKTNSRAKVDVLKFAFDKKMALRILKKYGYKAPYTGDISNYSKNLKDLLRAIGDEFNEIVRTEYKINGVIRIDELPKWKVIGSHAGRRSFITYNIMRGKTEAEVRECSGHKSSDAFARYVVFDD